MKYGGNAMTAEGDAGFARDVVLMHSVGLRPVVVHGGGPQITELMSRLGKEATFRNGLRVTDAESLEITRMVLVGKVNRELVGAINRHGPLAVGVSGEDAGLIEARRRDPELGFVGDVATINPALLERLLAERLIPVVATIGVDEEGRPTTSTPTRSPAPSPRPSRPRRSSSSPTSTACAATSTRPPASSRTAPAPSSACSSTRVSSRAA